jgi:hypothetical protein
MNDNGDSKRTMRGVEKGMDMEMDKWTLYGDGVKTGMRNGRQWVLGVGRG